MSRHFSFSHLFKVVTQNDIDGLRKAMFYLDYRIHNIRVWRDWTAMAYATKRGHFEMARILLEDLFRYLEYEEAREVEEVNWRIADVLTEILPDVDCESGREFVILICKRVFYIFMFYGNREEIIRSLVLRRAFAILDIIADVNEESIPLIVKYSMEFGKHEISLMSDKVVQHASFLSVVRELESGGNLVGLAMLQNDMDSLHRELEPRSWNSWMTAALIVSEYNDVQMFRELFNPNRVRAFFSKYDDRTPEDLIKNVLMEAIHFESCELLTEILQHEFFDLNIKDWMELYFDLLFKGNVRLADCVKHLVDWTNRTRRDSLFIELTVREHTIELLCQHSADLVMKVVKAVEGLPVEEVPNDSMWRNHIVKLPMEHNRPDLVKVLTDYGVRYTVEEVLKVAQKRHKSKKFDLATTATRVVSMDSTRIHCEQLLCASSECSVFIGLIHRPHVEMHLYRLFQHGVIETGKRTAIEVVADRLEPEDLSRLQDVESERRRFLNLKKLCRLSVRGSIIAKRARMQRGDDVEVNCGVDDVIDDVMSLYVDGHLPKALVEYLLYRDGANPLNYRIMSYLLV